MKEGGIEIKRMPTMEELVGFVRGSSGRVTVVFNRETGEFEMIDRVKETTQVIKDETISNNPQL